MTLPGKHYTRGISSISYHIEQAAKLTWPLQRSLNVAHQTLTEASAHLCSRQRRQ